MGGIKMEKERRLIYHRDLGSLECFEEPVDLNEYVWDFVGRIAGTQVDTFVCHIIHNLYVSRLKTEEYISVTDAPVGLMGEHATWAESDKLAVGSWRILENMKVLMELKFDPVAALSDAVHK